MLTPDPIFEASGFTTSTVFIGDVSQDEALDVGAL